MKVTVIILVCLGIFLVHCNAVASPKPQLKAGATVDSHQTRLLRRSSDGPPAKRSRRHGKVTDIPDVETPWPASLLGRNLLLAGDSNDRNFAQFLCNAYGGTDQLVTSLPMRGSSVSALLGTALNLTLSANITQVMLEYPQESGSHICHLKQFNASVMSFFHLGITGMDPELWWHTVSSALRMDSHWPSVPELTPESRIPLQLSPVELVSLVWPAAADMYLPQRPAIIVTQSSLWDTLLFSEYEPLVVQAEQTFPSWDWQARASKYLQAVRSSTLPVERILWRTNPDCPIDYTLLRDLHSLQSSCVRDAIKTAETPWQNVRLVDWKAHYPVTEQSQCAAVFQVGQTTQPQSEVSTNFAPGWSYGVHYNADGYRAYLAALLSSL